MKRILSVVSVLPLAMASLLAIGTPAGAATARATTAATISSTPSTVTAPPKYRDYPDFKCKYVHRYNDNKHERDWQYLCSYRYYYHGKWYTHRWWFEDANYDPPDRSGAKDYPDFQCKYVHRYNDNKHERDWQYRCSYQYYYHGKWYTHRWWLKDANYDPPELVGSRLT